MPFLISALLGLIVLCGCSRIPEPAAFDYSSQSKMQAAHHWDILAQDVADQINRELIKDDLLSTAVYVKNTCGKDDAPCKPNETSQFDEGFHDLLVTQLVRLGIPTCTEPELGAITINYKVQTVYHQTDRVRTFTPGMLTALSAAVVVLRHAPTDVLIVSTGAAADLANFAFVDSSHYEIIITTSMVSMRKYLFRTSSIYYINDADFWQYQIQNGGKAKEIRVTNTDRRFRKTGPEHAPDPPVAPAPKPNPDAIRDI